MWLRREFECRSAGQGLGRFGASCQAVNELLDRVGKMSVLVTLVENMHKTCCGLKT